MAGLISNIKKFPGILTQVNHWRFQPKFIKNFKAFQAHCKYLE
jgi:hypothetical protein